MRNKCLRGRRKDYSCCIITPPSPLILRGERGSYGMIKTRRRARVIGVITIKPGFPGQAGE
jgi:hypothetical protein